MKQTRIGQKWASRNGRNRIMSGVLGSVLILANPARGFDACDLDGSGATNVVDVTRAVGMTLGTLPCTANVEGPQTCSVVTIQRVVNAALGQPCVTFASANLSAALSWLPSPSAGVTGYNVYRQATPTGVRTKLNTAPVAGTTFTDNTIQLGQTYYYSATATDASGNESPFSTPVALVVPVV